MAAPAVDELLCLQYASGILCKHSVFEFVQRYIQLLAITKSSDDESKKEEDERTRKAVELVNSVHNALSFRQEDNETMAMMLYVFGCAFVYIYKELPFQAPVAVAPRAQAFSNFIEAKLLFGHNYAIFHPGVARARSGLSNHICAQSRAFAAD